MNILVVSDIFGRTTALENLVEYLAGSGEDSLILDPYDGHCRNFASEAEAYNAFQREVGLENYTHAVEKALQHSTQRRTVLIGFSVGASAIWAASPTIEEPERFRGICFYSSQIRNSLDISPKIDIVFYLARSEQKYDVEKTASFLAAKKRVKCFQTDYMHGFMNEQSPNFHAGAYETYRKILRNSLSGQESRRSRIDRQVHDRT